MQECRYSDDGSTISVNTEDIEKTLRSVVILKRNWKYFDCYCYSVLTDDLPVEKRVVYNDLKTNDLKARKILSFRKLKKEGKIKDEKNEIEKVA